MTWEWVNDDSFLNYDLTCLHVILPLFSGVAPLFYDWTVIHIVGSAGKDCLMYTHREEYMRWHAYCQNCWQYSIPWCASSL